METKGGWNDQSQEPSLFFFKVACAATMHTKYKKKPLKRFTVDALSAFRLKDEVESAAAADARREQK